MSPVRPLNAEIGAQALLRAAPVRGG